MLHLPNASSLQKSPREPCSERSLPRGVQGTSVRPLGPLSYGGAEGREDKEAKQRHSAEATRLTGYVRGEVCFPGTSWPDKSGGARDRETLAGFACLGDKAPVGG